MYSGVTFQKMIKIGRHLAKLFQFITTQVTLCSFLGHPVNWSKTKEMAIVTKGAGSPFDDLSFSNNKCIPLNYLA